MYREHVPAGTVPRTSVNARKEVTEQQTFYVSLQDHTIKEIVKLIS